MGPPALLEEGRLVSRARLFQPTRITEMTSLRGSIPAGPPGPLPGNTLVELASGLLFQDTFNRSDRDLDGDNGWISTGGAGVWRILSNVGQKHAPGANNFLIRTVGLSKSQDIIAEFIQVTPTDRDSMMVRWKQADPTSDTWYRAEFKLGTIQLFESIDGVESSLASVGVALVAPFRARMILRDAGANTVIKVYTDGTLQITSTDTTGQQGDAYDQFGFRLQDNPNSFDDAFVCGVDVICANMLAGYKIQLDAGPKFVESGGIAVADVDALALPWTTINLLDGADVVKDSISPVGGGWGGHQFLTVLP